MIYAPTEKELLSIGLERNAHFTSRFEVLVTPHIKIEHFIMADWFINISGCIQPFYPETKDDVIKLFEILTPQNK